MNLRDAYQDGIRQQIKRVMDLLGEERTEMGLTAFVDGQSSWSSCFFARALHPVRLISEYDVARELDLKQHGTNKLNLVPVRIVYRTFDGCSSIMSKKELAQFIRDVRDDKRADEALALIAKMDYSGIETTPVKFGGPSCTNPWGVVSEQQSRRVGHG